jgi:hypothetical protein
MKKLFLRFLRAPHDFYVAVSIGIQLRKYDYYNRIYIFDFDNTIAATAKLIHERSTYNYDISDLLVYDRMRSYILARQRRGKVCLVLSARPRSDRAAIIERLAHADIHIPVEVVSSHWLKAVALAFSSNFRSVDITLIDDMMRGEETGKPEKLFFPHFIVSKRVRLVTHKTVQRLR